MQKSDLNLPPQGFPKYLILLFVGILAIIGFGIGQKAYRNKFPASAKNISDASIGKIPVNFASLPVVKEGIKDPSVKAKNIILLDATSKKMLYGKGAQDKVAIASVTKVMTAIVAFESSKINDISTVTKEDIDVSGSKIGLRAGEQINNKDLVKGMLIKSGNDTAQVIARAIGGNQESFVKLMNQKATSFGLKDTKYMDPHGLSPDAYSTAFDQAVIFSYAIAQPEIKDIMQISDSTISSADGKITHILKNSNRLVTDEVHFDGIIGGKTGFTYEAGHSLVAAATRDNHTLISVVLNTSSQATDASAIESAKLLNWGFENYEWK